MRIKCEILEEMLNDVENLKKKLTNYLRLRFCKILNTREARKVRNLKKFQIPQKKAGNHKKIKINCPLLKIRKHRLSDGKVRLSPSGGNQKKN